MPYCLQRIPARGENVSLVAHLGQSTPSPTSSPCAPSDADSAPGIELGAQLKPVNTSLSPGHHNWFRNGRKTPDGPAVESRDLCCSSLEESLSLSLHLNLRGCEAGATASTSDSEPENRTSTQRREESANREICFFFVLFEP